MKLEERQKRCKPKAIQNTNDLFEENAVNTKYECFKQNKWFLSICLTSYFFSICFSQWVRCHCGFIFYASSSFDYYCVLVHARFLSIFQTFTVSLLPAFFLFIPRYKLMLLKSPTRTTIAQSDNSDANEWLRRYVFFFVQKKNE